MLDRQSDVGLLVINAVESERLKKLHHFFFSPLAYDDVAAYIQQHMLQTVLPKKAAEIGAPVLALAVQRRNENGVSIHLQRRLAEFFGPVTGTQIEHLETRFLQRQLHNAIADDVDVVPDDPDHHPSAATFHFVSLGVNRRDLHAQPLKRGFLD
jgi:hypothetical protein